MYKSKSNDWHNSDDVYAWSDKNPYMQHYISRELN